MTESEGALPLLGLRTNWRQFSLLVLVNAFVGAMVGLERSILPALAERRARVNDEGTGRAQDQSGVDVPLGVPGNEAPLSDLHETDATLVTHVTHPTRVA